MVVPGGGTVRSGFHERCFACGAENPDGLRLQFNTSGPTATGSVVIGERFRGYEGTTQGGIVATILDAAMVRLLHDLSGGSPVTGRLEVHYIRPVPVRKQVAVTARCTERRGNVCRAEAEICDEAERCATARGVFRIFSPDSGVTTEENEA